MVWAEWAHQNQRLVTNSWMSGIYFHVQASENTTKTNVDRANAPTHHQDHISAENREPRTRGIPYWEADSHETRESTLSSWPSKGCSKSGLWYYPHACVQQFLTCLKHRFPTWNTGVPILLSQWWVTGCTQTMDLGRNSQISSNSLWGLHELQHSLSKTAVLRAELICQSFQSQRKNAPLEKQVSTDWRDIKHYPELHSRVPSVIFSLLGMIFLLTL